MAKKVKEPSIIDIDLERKMKSFLDNPNGIKKFMEYQYFIGQHNEHMYGTKTPPFDSMKITEKVKHGWMRGIAFTTESMINGRWEYWLNIRATQEVEGKDIPQIHFYYSYDSQYKYVSNMIADCLKYLERKGIYGYKALECFIDWLLFAFGSGMCTKLPHEITDDVNEYWYRNFKAQYMFIYPSDYFVNVASEIYSSKAFNANAFYPTPAHIVQFMTEIVYTDCRDKEKAKYAAVCEPCMGSGIMLLYQSNKSLRLYGQDIDQLMCKIATVNGYLYVPWMVEGDSKTDKLLADMHDKYWNGQEDIFDDEFISFLNKPMLKESDKELIKSLNQ